jgi:cytochrome b561
MNAALAHTVMLVFAAAVAVVGWLMAHNSARASRFLTFGLEPAFGAKYCIMFTRFLGWFFFIMSGLGTVLYMILVPLDILHSH